MKIALILTQFRKAFICRDSTSSRMSKDRAVLQRAIEKGEEKDGSVEFKSSLSRDTHYLQDKKRESLVAQMKYRVMSGDGEATYVLGVSDDGELKGLPSSDFSETMDVLSLLTNDAGVRIDNVETWEVEEGTIVGLATIEEGGPTAGDENHLVIGTAGHVDHGKSTLVGSLMTGESDDGDGDTRAYMDVKPHEVERGLSADLSYALYGFKDGQPLRMENPNRNTDRSEIVEESDKLVSFVDTVGHQPWLRTTIRGIVGQKIDYGLLTVAADDGPTQTTKEHLGLLIATELPVLVCITKTDMVSEERVDEVEKEIEKLIRQVNRTPLSLQRHGVETAVDEIHDDVVPILRTSAVTMEGFDTLDEIMEKLPPKRHDDGESKMYIDKVYNIDGVGPVVSGSIQSGEIEVDDELLIGPFSDGSFRETKARSIEIHYYDVDKAKAGQIASVAVSNVDVDELERGMVLLEKGAEPKATKSFEAEVMVLNHPTSITDGYEPVIHLETISETVVIEPSTERMLAGDKGHAKFRFKFNPHYIEEGQKFIFREGRSKGVGKVTKVDD